ncbi:MAG: M20/M25/M40 family metallo-hydrolase [Chloroflexota bacterium]
MTETTTLSTKNLITHLSTAIGVTGYRGSDNIHDAIIQALEPYTDQVEKDRMGSVVGVKFGEQADQSGDSEAGRRKIMIAAHLDEIGMVVTKIDQGFLRFSQIGGLDDRVLMGQTVIIHGERPMPGIIGSTPPHLLPPGQSNNRVNHAEMVIDVGLPPRQVERLVQIGDIVSFDQPPVDLLNGLVSGKAMDNRASVAAMILALRELTTVRHQWDVYAVATADEEWGNFVGATTQAYTIHPDIAIVLDVTFADVAEIEVKLNGGPVLGLGPSNHPVIRQRLLDICSKLELKHQNEVMPSGAGTDAYAIEVSREGIPTILISLPSRYMHSPVEVVSLKDMERTGRLIAYFISQLDETLVEALIPV